VGDDFSRGRQADYVLSPFSKDQRPEVDIALDDSTDAVFTFLRAGIEQAMNDHN